MALIKCPECGREISDTCEQCIHCGMALENASNNSKSELPKMQLDKKTKKITGIVLGVVAIVVVLALILSSGYRYSSDGFVGLSDSVTIEMGSEKIKAVTFIWENLRGTWHCSYVRRNPVI